jgi:hypothetical protein
MLSSELDTPQINEHKLTKLFESAKQGLPLRRPTDSDYEYATKIGQVKDD